MLGSSGKEDLVRIILAWYPCLEAISFKLTGTVSLTALIDPVFSI